VIRDNQRRPTVRRGDDGGFTEPEDVLREGSRVGLRGGWIRMGMLLVPPDHIPQLPNISVSCIVVESIPPPTSTMVIPGGGRTSLSRLLVGGLVTVRGRWEKGGRTV
jgi:hypothetical protein